ncbi:SH3 domain-containing protein [Streptomyces sp. SCSIO ZS0520]|uniref:SH3 domain-containing protein n=1 Tax=Streptomyces sp. SCSIO ZS0520 TaxID=2892996 RepID=UPI0021DA3475|nr:SH3 domain-containing protein [Streptomyces sp. SCSIO ZS0520]
MDKRVAVRAGMVAAASALSLGVLGASTASAIQAPLGPGSAGGASRAETQSRAESYSVPMLPGPVGGSSASTRYRYMDSAYVTVDGLRVRTGPGTGNGILGLLYEGEGVRLIGARQDSSGQIWNKVALTAASAGGLPTGYTGWVTQAYLY